MGNYSAVWRSGSGAQHWIVNYSFDDLKSADDTHFANGLRLKVLRSPGDGSYLAVWRPGSGGQHWWAGISHDEWHPIDTEMFNKGYRIVSLDYRGDNISVVYRPGSGAQYVHGGITFDQFKQLDDQYFSEGLRLVMMMRDYNGWNEFMAVWRSGTGGQHWYTNTGSSWDDFKLKNQQFENEGYRLIAFPPFAINAIWRAGSGAQRIDYAVSLDKFKDDDKKHFKDGLRLIDLSAASSL